MKAKEFLLFVFLNLCTFFVTFLAIKSSFTNKKSEKFAVLVNMWEIGSESFLEVHVDVQNSSLGC